ncbi:GGDEF domain-containing protein [Paenibacillus rhizovicinus]|uniref:GGDEF domain-containing protein n=1 Tax=Paenibacillus rhizovicinus TaxID=2704463 RepID=A0A6C0P6H6_9BACL|nr:GGDEF domain-containing protein [Paenibacillus rhizovicinus]QHW33936.1 GGDEF domain-containing protein [Paenibacillus rhizovicinus]
MDEIGYGLLDRTMINRLTEQWHYGGIGVIIVHVQGHPSASVHEVMLDWMKDQRRVAWRYRMENDFYYFLQRGKSEEQLEKLTKRAVEGLRERLRRVYVKEEAVKQRSERRAVTEFAIGFALAFPSGIGRSAEATVYNAIKEALSAVMRYRFRQEHAFAAHEQTAATDEGLLGGPPLHEMQNPGSDALSDHRLPPQADRIQHGRQSPFPIGALAKSIPTFYPDAIVSDLARMFESNQHVQGAVIASEGRPLGLVMKENMNQLLAGQFGLPLYWNRPIAKIMDEEALVVDASWPVEQVAQMAMARDISRLYHVVIITRDEKLIGAASIRSILECLTQLRTEEARTANPLTGLPGNAVIQRELQRRIDAGRPFAIVYADLDYFKWFNDCFGFSQGDELIRYLAAVLQHAQGLAGSKDDFVGHIGGDDFILLSDVEDAAKLCRLMIARFDGGVQAYYGGAELPVVTDRSGNPAVQEGVTLSLSLLLWDGLEPITTAKISQAAARLKKQAKSISGSTYVSGNVYEKHLGEGKT